MSATGDGDDEIPGREIAYRVFAAEYDDADLSYAESDEERAPNYVITPTGARLNRVFAVGTLTEVTAVNEEMVRARVVDPTGAFVVYAGQYQPDELAALEKLDPPAFVAVTGKARTFQPEDSDQVYTSIRPESIATVDAATRDRWVVSAAEQTLDRIGTYAAAVEVDAGGETLSGLLADQGVENGLAAGVPIARDHYETTADYLAALRECAREAVAVVAGDREQVAPLEIGPRGSSAGLETAMDELATLSDVELDADAIDDDAGAPAADPVGGSEDAAAEPSTIESGASGSDDLGTGSAAGTATARPESADASDPIAVSADDDAIEDGDPDADTDTESDAAAAATPSGSATDAGVTSADTEPAGGSDSGTDTGVDDFDTGSDDPEAGPADTDGDADDLGDFDAGGSSATETEPAELDEEANDAPSDDDLGDFEDGDGMYEMDEAEREQIEEEFGTEFTTGTEVDEPGESDIDVPAPDDAESDRESDATDPAAATAGEDTAADNEDEGSDVNVEDGAEESEADADDGTEDGETDDPAEDVDLQSRVVDTMASLDDGDGADRTELVETVADETGADEGDVEDAIQDALMGGQCYEPDDGTLKPI